MSETLPGKYIVFEGHDGTGKSTQVRLTRDFLCEAGYDAIMIEEPGSDDPEMSTPVADALRAGIKNGELERAPEINMLLFSAARRELLQQKIMPQLARGGIVLSARNYYSSIAYQGGGEGLSIDYIEDMTRLFTNERYMTPDISLILTLNDEVERAKRIANRGALEHLDTFESKDEAFQRRVQNDYLRVAQRYNLPTIDASKSVDAVNEEIMRHISQHIAIPRFKKD